MSSIADIRSAREGITKKTFVMPLSNLLIHIKNNTIQIADFNRAAVAKRSGDANLLLDSIARNMSIGKFLGYQNIKPTKKMTFQPTTEKPVYPTDSGHRIRWLREIEEGVAMIDGKNMNMLRMSDPDIYNAIMTYEVTFEVTYHESGTVSDSFLKEEYRRVNMNTEPLSNGEILRASTNEIHNALVQEMDAALSITRKVVAKREKHREAITALVNGIVHGPDHMSIKRDMISEASKTISPEMRANAERVMRAYINLEGELMTEFAGDKAKTKLLKSRKVDVSLDGMLVAALQMAGNLSSAMDDIKAFYRSCLADKETWKMNMRRVSSAAPGDAARSFTVARFRYGWAQLQAIVHPQPLRELIDVEEVD